LLSQMIIKIYLVICLQTLRTAPILAFTLLTGFATLPNP